MPLDVLAPLLVVAAAAVAGAAAPAAAGDTPRVWAGAPAAAVVVGVWVLAIVDRCLAGRGRWLTCLVAALVADGAVLLAQQRTGLAAAVVVAVTVAAVTPVAVHGRGWLSAGALVAAGATVWLALHQAPPLVAPAAAVGARSGTAFAVVLWALVASALSVHRAVRASRRMGVVRVGLQALDDAMSGTPNVAEGLRAALPMIRRVLPTDHVVVLGRSRGDRVSTPLAAWPTAESADSHLGAMLGLDEALTTNRVVRVGHHSFMPIGYVGTEQLALAVRHRADIDTVEATRDTVELVAAAFLKLTARASFVDELRRESRTDALTGLANRRALFERLGAEMTRATRLRTPLTVAMLDLDHFKRYNDTFGHVQGDNLLRAAAAVFTSSIRGRDLAARYGGEEFVIVLPDTDLAGGAVLMNRLRVAVAQIDSPAPVTMSVGVTHWNGAEAAATLIERADSALYAAKTSGRDRVQALAAARPEPGAAGPVAQTVGTVPHRPEG